MERVEEIEQEKYKSPSDRYKDRKRAEKEALKRKEFRKQLKKNINSINAVNQETYYEMMKISNNAITNKNSKIKKDDKY